RIAGGPFSGPASTASLRPPVTGRTAFSAAATRVPAGGVGLPVRAPSRITVNTPPPVAGTSLLITGAGRPDGRTGSRLAVGRARAWVRATPGPGARSTGVRLTADRSAAAGGPGGQVEILGLTAHRSPPAAGVGAGARVRIPRLTAGRGSGAVGRPGASARVRIPPTGLGTVAGLPAGGRVSALSVGPARAPGAGGRAGRGPAGGTATAARIRVLGPIVAHRIHPFSSAGLRKRRWGPPKWSPSRKMSGGVLLSHAVPRAVPSAQKGLASGFGMGPGVSLSPWPPKLYGDVVVQTTAPREPHSGRVAFVVKSSAY